MRRLLVTCVLLGGLAGGGCADMGISNPFGGSSPMITNNGVEVAQSDLLGVVLPSGMRRFPSHGYRLSSLNGGEGLEVLRGSVGGGSLMNSLHTGLSAQGWNVRSCWRKDDRIMCVYENQSRVAVIRISSQAMLSLLDIWAGSRLPDGSPLNIPVAPPASGGSAASPSSSDSGGFEPEGTPQDWGGSSPSSSSSGGWGGSSGGLEERPL